jgi:hypothetical protein
MSCSSKVIFAGFWFSSADCSFASDDCMPEAALTLRLFAKMPAAAKVHGSHSQNPKDNIAHLSFPVSWPPKD